MMKCNLYKCIRPKSKENIKPQTLLRFSPPVLMQIFDHLELDEILQYLQVHPSEKLMEYAKERIRQFKELKITWKNFWYITPEVLELMSKNVTHFYYDGASMYFTDINEKVLENFFKHVEPTQLRQLSIRSVVPVQSTVDMLKALCSQVTKLDLSYCTMVDSMVGAILSNCVNLVEFTMLGNREFRGLAMKQIHLDGLQLVIVERGKRFRSENDFVFHRDGLTILVLENSFPSYIIGEHQGRKLSVQRLKEIMDPYHNSNAWNRNRHRYREDLF